MLKTRLKRIYSGASIGQLQEINIIYAVLNFVHGMLFIYYDITAKEGSSILYRRQKVGVMNFVHDFQRLGAHNLYAHIFQIPPTYLTSLP